MSEQGDRSSGSLHKVGAQPPAASSAQMNAVPTPPAGRPLEMRAAVVSDLGRARDHQEDTATAYEPPDTAVLAQRGSLLIVADGMGGHNAGEVASRTAVNEIERTYYGGGGDDLAVALSQAVQAANQAVYRLAQADARRQGMGTTVTAVIVHDRDLWIANVGDSRAYLLRAGQISQITRDHSWVEDQVRAGVLTPEQARLHPQRNIITRAIGTGPSVDADFFTGALREGDVLVLCSDGLTGHVMDQEILETASQLQPDQAASRLIELANERGGADNISVIVARFEAAGAPAPTAAAVPPAAAAAHRSPLLWIGILLGVILGILLVAFWVLRQPPPDTTVPPSSAVAIGSPPATLAAAGVTSPTLTTTTALTTSQPLLDPSVVPAGTLDPTATLRPTDTPAPPTATPTRIPTQSSASPTPTATLIGGAPVLQEPRSNLDISGDQLVTFVWDWAGPLPADQAFEVRIWKEGQPVHLGAAQVVMQPEGGVWQQSIRVNDAPAVRAGGDGIYFWTVGRVRRAGETPIGNEAPPRRFIYRSDSGGPEPTATVQPPTDTPKPPTETPLPTDTPEPR